MRRAVESGAEAAATAVAGPVAGAVARPVVSRVSRWWWLLLVPLAFLGAIMLAGLLGLTSVISAMANSTQGISAAGGRCFAGDVEIDGWDDEQIEVATQIAEVWAELSLPPKALVVAYVTGFVESGMRNLDYGDRDSLGWAQQRPSIGWGTEAEVQDVRLAARAFFGQAQHTDNPGLVDIAGWEDMDVGTAAQLVQRSAFPSRYAEWEQQAQALASLIIDEEVITCEEVSGDWVLPLASYSKPFSRGQLFGYRIHPITGVRHLHTGLDFAAPMGSEIYAVSGGTVVESYFQSSYGNQILIDHGGGIQSRYAHNSVNLVSVGDEVQPGDLIGLVGSTGSSTGPHIHFMIQVDGRPVDPLPFLRERGLNP